MAIDSGTATVLVGLGVMIVGEGGAMLFWGGSMTARVKRLETDVEPIATLRADMAVLTERLDRCITLLEKTASDTPRRRREAGNA